eukprot:2571559-Amphidinium_carterae.1
MQAPSCGPWTPRFGMEPLTKDGAEGQSGTCVFLLTDLPGHRQKEGGTVLNSTSLGAKLTTKS